jgi:hypothetical protein
MKDKFLPIVVGFSKQDIENAFRNQGLASSFSVGVKIFITDIVENKKIPPVIKSYHPIKDGRKTSIRIETTKIESFKEIFYREKGEIGSISMLINNFIGLIVSGDCDYDTMWGW